jgi:hypothetical protein
MEEYLNIATTTSPARTVENMKKWRTTSRVRKAAGSNHHEDIFQNA